MISRSDVPDVSTNPRSSGTSSTSIPSTAAHAVLTFVIRFFLSVNPRPYLDAPVAAGTERPPRPPTGFELSPTPLKRR